MKITLNQIECLAIKVALIEYYQTISKEVLKKDICSPAKDMHLAIKHLKDDFKNTCTLVSRKGA